MLYAVDTETECQLLFRTSFFLKNLDNLKTFANCVVSKFLDSSDIQCLNLLQFARHQFARMNKVSTVHFHELEGEVCFVTDGVVMSYL